MPNTAVVVNYLWGAPVIAGIDLTEANCQLPMHHHNQHLQYFMTPDAVIQATRVVQSDFKSAANVQECAELFFQKVFEKILA